MSVESAETLIRGGMVLVPGEGLVRTDILYAGDSILQISTAISPVGRRQIDATGCVVLPGIVDVHGDAFERQIMPRPKTMFPLGMALIDTDRQLAANGITTAYHGITVSWEPGLRSIGEARRIVAALDDYEDQLLVDNRIHIRWETFAIDEAQDVITWFSRSKKPALAFNDHTTPSFKGERQETKIRSSAERAMVDIETYKRLLDQKRDVIDEVSTVIDVMADIASSQDIPMLSHDDAAPETRSRFRKQGVSIAEFPLNWSTVEEAAAAGDDIVLGSPNVVRGGSHYGAITALEAITKNQCNILASDYYYPAPLQAALMLAENKVANLESAWDLISTNPAKAMRLYDRGEIRVGKRADLVIVPQGRLKPVATISAGRVVMQMA